MKNKKIIGVILCLLFACQVLYVKRVNAITFGIVLPVYNFVSYDGVPSSVIVNQSFTSTIVHALHFWW